MYESIVAVFIFWCSFIFSIGPFWIGVMESAKSTSNTELFKNFSIYQLTGWIPVIAVIGLIVETIGKIDENIFKILYFWGAGVIFYLAFKTLRLKAKASSNFKFTWKAMTAVSWVNPKVWLTIPVGYLAANFTDNFYINIGMYYLVGAPIYFIGLYLWAEVGRRGAKIAKDKLSYFNATLLVGFGIYLLMEGINKW